MTLLPDVEAAAESVLCRTVHIKTSKDLSPAHECLKLLSSPPDDSASGFSWKQIQRERIQFQDSIWESVENTHRGVEEEGCRRARWAGKSSLFSLLPLWKLELDLIGNAAKHTGLSLHGGKGMKVHTHCARIIGWWLLPEELPDTLAAMAVGRVSSPLLQK